MQSDQLTSFNMACLHRMNEVCYYYYDYQYHYGYAVGDSMNTAYDKPVSDTGCKTANLTTCARVNNPAVSNCRYGPTTINVL